MNKADKIHIDTIADTYKAFVKLKPPAKEVDLVITKKRKKPGKTR